MTANTLLGWQNFLKTATLSAGSTATNLPISNIAGDSGSPSLAWQTVSGVVTSAAGATLTITPFVTTATDVIGLFRTNLTTSAIVTASIYQFPATQTWTATQYGVVSGYGQIVFLPPASTLCDYVTITIDDIYNPDGFINVPLVYAGPAWRPLGSASFSSSVGRDASVTETTSRGGSEYPQYYYQRRRWNVQFDAMRTAETWASADPLANYAAGGSNVFFTPDTTSAYYQQEAVFGRLKSATDITYPYQGADRRRWSAVITERL